MPDPISCFCKPISMRRSIDVPLVLKDSGQSGQPHKLDRRDGVVQDDAGALHTVAAIHRLAPDHHFLSFDRQWGQCPHIDDYAEWGLLPCQNLLTLRVPLLDFSFRDVATEGEIES